MRNLRKNFTYWVKQLYFFSKTIYLYFLIRWIADFNNIIIDILFFKVIHSLLHLFYIKVFLLKINQYWVI